MNNFLVTLLILSVPFVVSICLLQYTVSFSIRQCEERSSAEINHMQELVERNLSVVRKQAMEMAQNRDLLLIDHYDSTSKDNIYKTSRLAQSLKEIAGTQEFSRGFYVYLKSADIILYNGSKMTSREFFNVYVKTGQYETWKSKLSREYLNDCRNSQGKINDLSEHGVIEYLQSFPLGGKANGTIVFLIDKSVFITKSITPKDSSRELYVFNQHNELVHGTKEIDDKQIKELLRFSEGSYQVDMNGKAFVFSETSDNRKLRYICIDRGSAAFKVIEKISFFIFIYALIIFFGGGFYIFSTSYQMSMRIKKINKLISKKESDESNLDWKSLLNGIEDLAKSRNSMRSIVASKNNIEKNMVIASFIYDYSIQSSKCVEQMEKIGVVLDGENYIFVIGTLDFEDGENEDLVKFAVQNIFSDLIKDIAKWYFFDFLGNRIIFLLKGSFNENTKNKINEIFGSVSDYILSILDVRVQFDVGQICSEVEELRLSAKKQNERSKFKTIYGEQIYSHTENSNYKYLQKQENELINLMFSGTSEELDNNIVQIISEHKNAPHIVKNTLYYNLFGTYLKCRERAKINETFDGDEIESILYAGDVSESEKKIRKLFFELSEKVTKENKKGKLTGLSVRLVDYVDANYTNPNISLKMLSAEFNITVPYISKVFKEQFGTNFSEYITNMRVQKAQQLLLSTNMSMSDIAKKLGYVDSSVFIKNFKKSTGMTPGAYRDTKA